ncbi:unnamed protein product [Prunus brigantina]
MGLKRAESYEYPFKKEDLVAMDSKSVWEGMEECQKLGLTKSTRVSNFSCKKLEILLATAKIPPAVNQVCLRCVYEQGVSLVVKSFNKDKIQENIGIFDWELSPQELDNINQIPQNRGFLAINLIADESPYKSLHELWDGEI